MAQTQFDTQPNLDPNLQQITQRASHLMWLERQLVTQRKNERMMLTVFALSIVFDIVTLFALLTFLREPLQLPDVVIGVVVGGLLVEMALLAYFTRRVSQRRRQLEQEIDQMTRDRTPA